MFERIPKSPPKIARLTYDVNRPLWSIMIPSYNCIHYLRYTINSVLSQALSQKEMQIEVIDDHSTDGDVEALVNEIGKGRVGFYRQTKNVGHLRNFETCINRAKGKLIHILHGDDAIKLGFYEELGSLFNKFPKLGAAFTHSINIDKDNNPLWVSPVMLDEPGVIENFLLKSAERSLLQTPSIVVKRSVYEDIGSFYGGYYGEDWLMWTRIAAFYEVGYSPKILAEYRVHTDNVTGNSLVTGQNIRDIKVIIDAIQEYIPKEKRRVLRRKAKRNYSTYITSTADWLYHRENDSKSALLQVWEVFKFYPSSRTFYFLVKISAKIAIGYKDKETMSKEIGIAEGAITRNHENTPIDHQKI